MTTEARFRITDPGTFWSLQTIDQLGDFKFFNSQILEIHDDYLDTKKRRLWKAGYYCRRREQDKGFLITFSELRSRKNKKQNQWEVNISKTTTNPDDWPKSPVKNRISKIIPNKKLQVMFSLIQTQIIRQVSDGSQIFAMVNLKDVLVINKGEEQNFKILELFAVAPDQLETLNSLAKALKEEWSLEKERLSKFERALKMESN
jgi:inorganic triphosphatase YgiF